MILAAKEELVLAQCDITAAFVTAPIPPNEVVYVEQPMSRKLEKLLRRGIPQLPRKRAQNEF